LFGRGEGMCSIDCPSSLYFQLVILATVFKFPPAFFTLLLPLLLLLLLLLFWHFLNLHFSRRLLQTE